MTQNDKKTGKDVKYIRVVLGCTAAESEYLIDADGNDIIGYIDGEDEPLLFPNIDNKHPLTAFSDSLVIDVKTGMIVNWKPYTDNDLDDILEDFENMRQEWLESGGYEW